MTKLKSEVVYGLDFGTSNSVISVFDGEKSESFDIVQSSIYAFEGKFHFGQEALSRYISDLSKSDLAKRVVVSGDKKLKIFQGSDLVTVNEVLEMEEFSAGRMIRSFKSILGNTFITKTEIEGKVYTFVELVAMFLSEIKRQADIKTGLDVKSVVVGRPVVFVGDSGDGSVPIANLTNALKLAGFENISFEHEPVGAAFGYGLKQKEMVFVFDFGGGTLDCAVVDLHKNEVKSSSGVAIGGDMLDLCLYETYVANYFGKGLTYGDKALDFPRYATRDMINWADVTKYRTDKFFAFLDDCRYRSNNLEVLENIRYLLRNNLSYFLRNEIKSAKELLSDVDLMNFKFKQGRLNIEEKFARDVFDKSMEEYLQKIKGAVDSSIHKSGLKIEQIDKVVMTGGSSYIPAFQELLVSIFGREKIDLFEPFTAVSKGLAVMGYKKKLSFAF